MYLALLANLARVEFCRATIARSAERQEAYLDEMEGTFVLGVRS